MIRIRKPTKPPEILRTKGKAKRAAHCREFTCHRSEFQNGTRQFDFDDAIYNAKEVKDALVKAQHGKCCFCESRIGYDGDVEHFRPKSAVSQGRGQSMQRPGYYWLAYDWKNLFLCCSACNTRHKRNYFPLAQPQNRCQSHRGKLSTEETLFINPTEYDPEEFISFRQEIAYPINNNSSGKTTIEALNLNREHFNERRRDRLNLLRQLHNIVKLENEKPATPQWLQVVAEAKQTLSEAVTDKAEFASLSRAAAKQNFYTD